MASIWIQTGLALTPFAFAETTYSVDWAIAWAMLGEWTNHHLFPPPASGEWPRFAHVGGLEECFQHRHPSLVTWARACFEQGALPSLSVLPGAVEVRSLTGDKMFQATHIVDGYQRARVLHGYGGAKSSMPTSLPELATKGWTVVAAALLGTHPVSHKEESLLLSRWYARGSGLCWGGAHQFSHQMLIGVWLSCPNYPSLRSARVGLLRRLLCGFGCLAVGSG